MCIRDSYGTEAYSAWNVNLEGRDFVTPEEIRDNPYQKKMVKEEVRTRKGCLLYTSQPLVIWLWMVSSGSCSPTVPV